MANLYNKYSVPKIAIVILSYNVRDLLLDCLKSVFASQTKADNWEVVVVDNASSDDSVAAVKKHFPQVKLVQSSTNTGYSAGNNLGVKATEADYVLFLNPDTLVKGRAIQASLEYLEKHAEFGAATCRVELPDGRLDYSCHRGLPTPWNALSYFSGLAKAFPKVKLFSGYTASYQDLNTDHEIDCATGAFLLVRWQAGQQINWWDEDYFWNGEDIEFCYQLRQHNWKIAFLPSEKIIHFKGSSSGLWKTGKTKVDPKTQLATAREATKAMRIFYQKHFQKGLFGALVWFGISLLEKTRLAKLKLGVAYGN